MLPAILPGKLCHPSVRTVSIFPDVFLILLCYRVTSPLTLSVLAMQVRT